MSVYKNKFLDYKNYKLSEFEENYDETLYKKAFFMHCMVLSHISINFLFIGKDIFNKIQFKEYVSKQKYSIILGGLLINKLISDFIIIPLHRREGTNSVYQELKRLNYYYSYNNLPNINTLVTTSEETELPKSQVDYLDLQHIVDLNNKLINYPNSKVVKFNKKTYSDKKNSAYYINKVISLEDDLIYDNYMLNSTSLDKL